MKVRAYAKINLGLHVLGKRPDGYHTIETVFRLINLFDELDLLQNDAGIHFSSNVPELKNDSSNLCVRAAHLLRDLTGSHIGVDITLKKNIPIGSGLGGGSSDAAAVLKGLTKLWALDISDEELQTISATLGSDVPFFFTGQTAYATGRGEVLSPFDLTMPYTILVATPNVHVSTAWAYSAIAVKAAQKRANLRSLLQNGHSNPAALRESLMNDFELSVFQKFPEIRDLKEALLSGGADYASMSGSGSSVFGLFLSPAPAIALAQKLSTRYFTSVTDPKFKPEIN